MKGPVYLTPASKTPQEAIALLANALCVVLATAPIPVDDLTEEAVDTLVAFAEWFDAGAPVK